MGKPEPEIIKGPMSPLKHSENWVKSSVFFLLQLFFKKGRKDILPIDGTRLEKVLFIRPESTLGDMVISLPVIDRLKELYPQVKISVLGSRSNYALIKDDPRFDKIFLYRKRIWEDIREMGRIRKEKYDCVFDLLCDDSVTCLFLSQLSSPGKPRIGVGKIKFDRYYDFNEYTSLDDSKHIIMNTMKLLKPLGVDTDRLSGFSQPFVYDSSMEKADNFIREIKTKFNPSHVFGLNLSAGAKSRYWAEENYIQLLEKILGKFSKALFVLSTPPSERERCQPFLEKFKDNCVMVPDKLGIVDIIAIIRHLDLLISPDTSLVHIARSYKIPVVALYPGFRKNLVLWHPFGQSTGAILSGNMHNIFDIEVNHVYSVFLGTVKSLFTVEKQ